MMSRSECECVVYSNPTLSRVLLYRGIYIPRAFSDTLPPSVCLRSQPLEANVKLLKANKIG